MELSSVIVNKVTAAIGGLAGGASMMSYVKPVTVGEAFTRGGTSTAAAIIFSGPLLQVMGWPQGWEFQLVTGFVIGFAAFTVLGAAARWLDSHKKSDLFTMVRAARGEVELKSKPVAQKRATRRKQVD